MFRCWYSCYRRLMSDIPLISTVIVIICMNASFLHINAWTTIKTTSINHRLSQNPTHHYNPKQSIIHRQHGRTFLLYLAKPRPIDSFNLESIEAYEQELLNKGTIDDNDDDSNNTANNNDAANERISTFQIPKEFHQVRIDTVLSSLLTMETTNNNNNNNNNGSNNEIPIKISRSQVLQLLSNEFILLDNKIVTKKSIKVEMDQIIQIQWDKASSILTANEIPNHIIPENIPLTILYEDESILVIDKDSNVVVHPGAGNWNGTLVNAIAYYLQNTSPYGTSELFDTTTTSRNELTKEDDSITDYSVKTDTSSTMNELFQKTQILRPGIIHRLDKGTTGVIVIGKTISAVQNLSNQFATRQVSKLYVACTMGPNPGTNITINKPISRHPTNRQKMRVVPSHSSSTSSIGSNMVQLVDDEMDFFDDDEDDDEEDDYDYPTRVQQQQQSSPRTGRKAKKPVIGKTAISIIDTIYHTGQLGFVQVQIQTGRTHQIRVHLQDHKTPIIGDDVYGISSNNDRLLKNIPTVHRRPYLHAYQLSINHPITDEPLTFRAPIPNDMKVFITKFISSNILDEHPEFF